MTQTKPDTLAAALAEFQHKLPRIKKAETAQVRSDKGNYSYTYADLADVSAQVMPLLGECGLSFSARPTVGDSGGFVLAYELLHTSGESRRGEYPLPTGGTPQALGSAITYGRRYCLCAVTGVAPDDDDDGAAAQRPQQQQRATPDDDPWYTRSQEEADRSSAQQSRQPSQKALEAEQRKVMQAGTKVGLSTVEELAADYAARYEGADINQASIEELSVYLNVLTGLAEQEQQAEDEATDEAAAEAVQEAL